MSAIAYNLKKYLKFINKTVKSDAGVLHAFVKAIKQAYKLESKPLNLLNMLEMIYQ